MSKPWETPEWKRQTEEWDRKEEELRARIGEERVAELQYYDENETNDEETQEWRENLSPDEKKLIKIWERRFARGLLAVMDVVQKEETKGVNV